MIRFDFSGISQALIGGHGIDPADLEALSPAIDAAHTEILERRARGEILFYDLPDQQAALDEVTTLAAHLERRFSTIVHLGIGGSSLGPRTLFTALKPPLHNLHSRPRIFFIDNVDPEELHDLFSFINPAETLFIVASKSGGTPETAAQLMLVLDLLRRTVGERLAEHLVFITDPAKGALRQLARELGVPALSIPPQIGGRFSVLTPVGLLPACLLGIDIHRLMHGARRMRPCLLEADPFKNPAYLFGAIHFLAMARGVNVCVLMPYAAALKDLADWFGQLWAESLGKKLSRTGKVVHTGQTPVKALGATDQHSQVQLYMEGPFDKIIHFITVGRMREDLTIPSLENTGESMSYLAGKSISELLMSEAHGTRAALSANGRMTTHIALESLDEETMGALLLFFEAATAFTGTLLGIDPFDQPGVELGKQLTFGRMGREGYEHMVRTSASDERLVIEI